MAAAVHFYRMTLIMRMNRVILSAMEMESVTILC